MADEILGGVLTDASKVTGQPTAEGLIQEKQEELPELTESAHEVLMSHVLGEGKRMDAVKTAVGRAKSYVTGDQSDYRNRPRKESGNLKTAREVDPKSKHLGLAPARTLKGDLKSLAGRVKKFAKKVVTPSTPEELKAMGHQDRNAYLRGEDVKPLPKPKDFETDKSGTVRSADSYGVGQIKPISLTKKKKAPVKKMKNENLNQDQIEILRKAKEIVSEMTSVGAVGVNMAGGDKGQSHHPALQVKLPGDKDQAKQIKAASTPPKIMQVKAPKDASPGGRKNNNKGVKRKSAQSKDDETQFRIHQDMQAMYHESFNNFVGELLTENATGKGYKGDVSVADFGRKGPASDTFGAGGVRTGGRGPVVKLTKNQLMTAKKKPAGSGQDKGESGFGKASSHSRKHPQNPYAGGK